MGSGGRVAGRDLFIINIGATGSGELVVTGLLPRDVPGFAMRTQLRRRVFTRTSSSSPIRKLRRSLARLAAPQQGSRTTATRRRQGLQRSLLICWEVNGLLQVVGVRAKNAAVILQFRYDNTCGDLLPLGEGEDRSLAKVSYAHEGW